MGYHGELPHTQNHAHKLHMNEGIKHFGVIHSESSMRSLNFSRFFEFGVTTASRPDTRVDVRRLLAVMVAMVFATGAAADTDFQNDLIPVLTKNGCNAGACHGAAIGRGGFKLSLYGGNPKADYEAIVRQMGGRRIHLANPEQSLVILKPAEHVEHGGGKVFDMDDPSAKRLKQWIRDGARWQSRREFQSLEIVPRQLVAKSVGEPVSIRAIAHFADGDTEDVTRWTVFKAEDESAVEIFDDQNDDGSQRATVHRRGRHIVVARYLNSVVPIELIVPITDSKIDLSKESRNNFVDDEILNSLSRLGLRPSDFISDSTFLRRVSLDLTGRLPDRELVKSFASDNQSGKRDSLINELLESDVFVDFWTLNLAKILRIQPQREDNTSVYVYHNWLKKQIRNHVSYRDIARTLILASGDSHKIGEANFYRTVGGPKEQAEFVSELFMGSRLRCANCHNHPLDRWTQDDYHGLTAIFAKIERGRVIKDKPSGQTIHPRTLQPAVPRIPGGPSLKESSDSQQRSADRRQFTDWLTADENPYFAKAIVNRLWKHMMGRGLVEPVDDFRSTNPATHPKLLDQLADDFVANDYSIRHTLKVIASSRAYSRSSNATIENKDDDRFYSHSRQRPLDAEVLADAISDVLGVPTRYGNLAAGTRAVDLANPQVPSRALDVLGRCDRKESCESGSGRAGGMPQKLHLFNGELLNGRIGDGRGRLAQLLSDGKAPIDIVEEFYLVALNRKPNQREQVFWAEQIASAQNNGQRQQLLEDFVWAMMTCEEFVNNH